MPRPTTSPVSRKGLILALVAVAQFMLVVDDTIVNVALPTLGSELDLAEDDLSWVVNAYFLTFGGFLLVGGRAADLLGRRRMLIASMLAFTGASLIAGLAPSGGVLVGARAVQGLAGAFLSPAALSILLATFRDGPERTKALGVWASLTALGAATGLLAGGALVEALDWRWVFFVNVPVGLAAVALVPRLIPADARPERRVRPDLLGAVLGTAALLLLVYTVVETDTHAWESARTIGGLAAVAVLAVLFVARERAAAEPLVPPALVSRRHVAVGNAVVAVVASAMFAMFFFLTLYLQDVQGYGALQAGASFLAFSGFFAISAGVATKVLRRVPARPLVVGGLLMAAASLWLMRGLDPGDSYTGNVMPMLMLIGSGMGFVFVPVMELATGGSEERDSGLASALITTSQQVGAAVGIAILVTISTDRAGDALAGGAAPEQAMTDGFAAAFTVASAAALGAAVLAVATQPLRRRRGGVRAEAAPARA